MEKLICKESLLDGISGGDSVMIIEESAGWDEKNGCVKFSYDDSGLHP
jgi:hypothetical protein